MVLAINGGTPLFELDWPMWPSSSPKIEAAVLRVLRSGRWAISGMSTGTLSEERQFGEEFAQYIGVPYGIPVTNGSSALVVALEAIGVGYGDEVLVPGLVWVACGSAVARVGGIPILVDVEKETFCMSVEAAEAAITERTKAILLVHLYSSVADLDAFVDLARRRGVSLIEDCSQAHGAMWRQKRVGSFGSIAAFSFQNSKLLTAGEGGIVTTADEALYDAAQQLRSDGRRWKAHIVKCGFPDLEEIGERQGHNHCMTEIQAAVLRASLRTLDEANRKRIRNVETLEGHLSRIEGVRVVRRRDPRSTVPTFFHLPIQIEGESFANVSIERIGAAVAAEIGLFLEPVDAPLDSHVLYQPIKYRRFCGERRRTLDVASYDLPNARLLSRSCFTLPHHALLAPAGHMSSIAEAIAHVQRKASEL